jgi:predicted nuclease of restriction endonuclease-like (RecB) superfamily
MAKKEVLEYNTQFSEYWFSLEIGDDLVIIVVENTNEIQGTNFYLPTTMIKIISYEVLIRLYSCEKWSPDQR